MVLIDYIDLKEKKRWWQEWYILAIKTEKTKKSDGLNGTHWLNRLNRTIEWMTQMVPIDYIHLNDQKRGWQKWYSLTK